MERAKQEEWKQVRDLHLIRDERDREVEVAARGRAGSALLTASQLLAALLLLAGDPAWSVLLALTFVSGAVGCFYRFAQNREWLRLILGILCAGAVAGLIELPDLRLDGLTQSGPGLRAVSGGLWLEYRTRVISKA